MTVTEPHRPETPHPPDPRRAEPIDDPSRPPAGRTAERPRREPASWFVVRMDPGRLWDPARPVREQAFWDGHARHMDALFDSGAVVLGGPFADRSGSLLVVRARDVRHVREMFRDDPWTVHDVLVAGEVKAWTIFLDGRQAPAGAGPAAPNPNPGDTR